MLYCVDERQLPFLVAGVVQATRFFERLRNRTACAVPLQMPEALSLRLLKLRYRDFPSEITTRRVSEGRPYKLNINFVPCLRSGLG
jgi:hypothetical protein